MLQTQQPSLFVPATPAPTAVKKTAGGPISLAVTEAYLRRKRPGEVPSTAVHVICRSLRVPPDVVFLYKEGDPGRAATELGTLTRGVTGKVRDVLVLLAQHLNAQGADTDTTPTDPI